MLFSTAPRILIFWITLLLALHLSAETTADTLPSQEGTDTIDIFLILEQLHRTESTLKQITRGTEENGSDSQSEILDQYAIKKADILAHFTSDLRNMSVAADLDKQNLLQEQKQLSFRIEANQQLGYDLAVARDETRMYTVTLKLRIQDFLDSLYSFMKEGQGSEVLKEFIQQEINQLPPVDKYQQIADAGHSGQVFDHFLQNYRELIIFHSSYREVLRYLLKYHADLVSQSLFLQKLSAYEIMHRIDAWVPFQIQGVGLGKVLMISFVLLFFFSIRKGSAKLAAFLINHYLIKEENAFVHAYFVGSIQRPISLLLIVYSLQLSFELFIYPDTTPEWAIQWINIIFTGIFAWMAISIVSIYGQYLSSRLISRSDTLRREVINMIQKLVYFAIFIIAMIVVFRIMNYNVSAIIASLGIGGLAVALAAKDTLANFFASIMILLDNSFSQGDWIECDGIEGTVVEIGLRKTMIRTFDNALLFVPNAKLAENSIRNWNRRKVGRRIKMHVTLTYSSSPEKLEKTVNDIREMLLTHEKIANPNLSRPIPPQSFKYQHEIISKDDLEGHKNTLLVYLDALESFSIDILIYCFSTTVNWQEWLEVKQDVILKIMKIVEANGLEFAFPSQSVYVESLPDSARQELDKTS